MTDNITDSQESEPQSKSHRTALLGIAGVIAGSVAIGVLMTGIAGGTQTGGRGRPTVTVGTAIATKGDLPIELDALGAVTPIASATVNPRASGTITRINFAEGENVRQGQVLAEIDPRPYAAALQQAQGQLQRDQALLENARVDLQRYTTLLAQDSISKQQVDTQRALVHQDQGVVASDRANVAMAQLNLSYCKITAPIAGRAGLRQIDLGNYVAAGSSTGMVVITQLDPIDIVFTLPEDDLPRVQARQRAHEALPVTALDRAGATTLAQGNLLTLDNVIDSTTGTVKAKARFANPEGGLFANQFVNVHLLVDTLKDAVTVPASAIRHGPKGDFVWILTPDKTADMRNITVGPIVGETASIASGLKLGETVITEGGDNLREGSPVALPGKPPPSAAGGHRSGARGAWSGQHRRRGQSGAPGGGGGAGGGGGGGGGSGP